MLDAQWGTYMSLCKHASGSRKLVMCIYDMKAAKCIVYFQTFNKEMEEFLW